MIHLIIGRQGSGKSLFLVFKAYQSYKKGLKVYSNIHLTYKCKDPILEPIYLRNKKGQILYDIDKNPQIIGYNDNSLLPKEEFFNKFGYYILDYNDIINCELENGIVLIDEVHLLLPARGSAQSVINRKVCDGFLSMVRKKGLEVYGTTQTTRKVDIRFREERDYFYICNKWVYENNIWHEAVTTYTYPADTPLMIRLAVFEEFSMDYLYFNFLGNSYFEIYDTKQIIKITGLEDVKNGGK